MRSAMGVSFPNLKKCPAEKAARPIRGCGEPLYLSLKLYHAGKILSTENMAQNPLSKAADICNSPGRNYRPGGEFFGAVLANESYLVASQSTNKKSQVIKEYKAHFGAGCSKALSCQSVCPVQIETLTSILRMNRK
jgi:hypothetical protein